MRDSSENLARTPDPGPEAPLSLVIQMARLGDFLQSTPLIKAVRQRHPQNRLAVLVTPAQAPLAHGCPDVDEVHELAPGPLLSLLDNQDLPPESKSAVWQKATRRLSALEVGQLYNLNLGALSGLLAQSWPRATAHAWRLHPERNALLGEPWSPFVMALAGKRNLTRLHLCDILSAYADPPARPGDALCFQPPPEAFARAREFVGRERPLVALQLGGQQFFAALAGGVFLRSRAQPDPARRKACAGGLRRRDGPWAAGF